MDHRLTLKIVPASVPEYSNAYTEKLKTEMFKETIRIQGESGVWWHWPSTRYRLESMPMASSKERMFE